MGLPTPRLRGVACAMAERAALRFLRSRDKQHLQCYLRCAALSHKAIDVPKKYEALPVKMVMECLFEMTGLCKRAPRSSKAMLSGRHGLRLHLKDLRKKNTYDFSGSGCKSMHLQLCLYDLWAGTAGDLVRHVLVKVIDSGLLFKVSIVGLSCGGACGDASSWP